MKSTFFLPKFSTTMMKLPGSARLSTMVEHTCTPAKNPVRSAPSARSFVTAPFVPQSNRLFRNRRRNPLSKPSGERCDIPPPLRYRSKPAPLLSPEGFASFQFEAKNLMSLKEETLWLVDAHHCSF